ncbi:MAG: FkbM family methyltransferase [Thermodesulfobacteriota bacterium]
MMRFLPQGWSTKYDASLKRRADAARQRAAMAAFYRRFFRPGELCFDVGANRGNRAAILADLGARVVCIEPQPSCVRELLKRFGRNANVTIVGAAVGEREGSGELAICEAEPTISTMSERWKSEGRFAGKNQWTKTVPVEVTTLDHLIARYGTPAFCKIDVEGFELSVLKGLSMPIPVISFEFTREFFTDAKSAIDHLLSIGPAVFNASFGESMTLLDERWMTPRELYVRIDAEGDAFLWGDIYARLGRSGRRG